MPEMSTLESSMLEMSMPEMSMLEMSMLEMSMLESSMLESSMPELLTQVYRTEGGAARSTHRPGCRPKTPPAPSTRKAASSATSRGRATGAVTFNLRTEPFPSSPP